MRLQTQWQRQCKNQQFLLLSFWMYMKEKPLTSANNHSWWARARHSVTSWWILLFKIPPKKKRRNMFWCISICSYFKTAVVSFLSDNPQTRLILLEDLSDIPRYHSGSHQLEPFSLLAAEIRCVISNNDYVGFAWPGLVAEGRLEKFHRGVRGCQKLFHVQQRQYQLGPRRTCCLPKLGQPELVVMPLWQQI